jgi:hypothetical protein
MGSTVPLIHENWLLRMCCDIVIKLHLMRAFVVGGPPVAFSFHIIDVSVAMFSEGSLYRCVLPKRCTMKQLDPIMHDMIAAGSRDARWDKKTLIKISGRL